MKKNIKKFQDEERPYDFDDALAGAERIFDMIKNMNIKQIPIILEELDSLRLGLQEIQAKKNYIKQ